MTWILRNMLVVAILMVLVAGAGHYFSGGANPIIALALLGCVIGLGLLAIVDGARRFLGHTSVLGRGRGLGRALGGIQLILGLAMLAGVASSLLQV